MWKNAEIKVYPINDEKSKKIKDLNWDEDPTHSKVEQDDGRVDWYDIGFKWFKISKILWTKTSKVLVRLL